jgi:hypothetical protein
MDPRFVDATLQWRHSHPLFTVPLAGREALVYVLVEHQSSGDPLMPFRMLRYMVRIWDRYLTEHPGAARLLSSGIVPEMSEPAQVIVVVFPWGWNSLKVTGPVAA